MLRFKYTNPANLTKSKEVELLVDSGAIFTSIPRNLLEEIGIMPFARRRLRIYGENIIERDICVGLVEYESKRAGTTIIFGEPGDTLVLGVTALESLGYQLDPVTKKLKPVELLMV